MRLKLKIQLSLYPLLSMLHTKLRYSHLFLQMSTISSTEESVFKKLSSLKTDKSPAPNNLHPKLLYKISHEIAGYLRDLKSR